MEKKSIFNEFIKYYNVTSKLTSPEHLPGLMEKYTLFKEIYLIGFDAAIEKIDQRLNDLLEKQNKEGSLTEEQLDEILDDELINYEQPEEDLNHNKPENIQDFI